MADKRNQTRDVVAFTDQDEKNFINGDAKLVHDLLNYARTLFSETFNCEGTLRDFLNNTRVIEQSLRKDKPFYPYFTNSEVNSNDDQKDTKTAVKSVNDDTTTNADLNADDFLNEIMENDDSVH
ncbi:MAG: hypothetical protein H9901_01895 [Candidatus Paralactobacillus gallistercoris]|uniref:Uncharacterized protein n=1 Tax=Candidatus Paralactobacillus gallistercoris TaxID=2838724 RepID=A0A948TIU8_9LACO|nr:hypothetical protein [Candidatus Paralactobacillus gallistercoris]